MKQIFSNWKTSLIGLAAGLLQMAQAWPEEAKRAWGMLGGLAIVLLGMLTKDATNKNGKD